MKKNYILFFEEFKFSQTLNLPKNKWIKIDPNKYPELSNEFFELISTAYKEIGGHAKVNSPKDVFKDKNWNYWEIIDIDKQPDVDLLIFGQKTKYGIKFSGVGHDGTKLSKKTYLEDTGIKLKLRGYYAEVSGKFAEILMNKYQVPTIEDENLVRKILKKDIIWYGTHPEEEASGNGWYGRKIGGHLHYKILVGNPK